jgi:hypothetical protein
MLSTVQLYHYNAGFQSGGLASSQASKPIPPAKTPDVVGAQASLGFGPPNPLG